VYVNNNTPLAELPYPVIVSVCLRSRFVLTRLEYHRANNAMAAARIVTRLMERFDNVKMVMDAEAPDRSWYEIHITQFVPSEFLPLSEESNAESGRSATECESDSQVG
jgi:hypothetical protein